MSVAAVLNGTNARLDDALTRAVEGSVERVSVTRTPAEATEFLGSALEAGASSVLIGGGDGTIAHALTALWHEVDRDDDLLPTIGILRLGTGNAVADAFEVPAATPRTAIDLIERLEGRELGEPLRTLRVEDRLGCFAGFGVDAQLLDDHERSGTWLRQRGLSRLASGALGYAVSTITRSLPRFIVGRRPMVTATNRGERARPAKRDLCGDANIEPDEVLWSGACTLAACATIPTFGFGLRMFALAEADRDRFQLRISDAGLLEILTRTRAAFRGEYYSPRVHDFLCDRVELTVSRPAPFELSGDLVGSRSRVEVYLGPTFELLV